MRREDPVAIAERLHERGQFRVAFRVLLRAAQAADVRAYLNLGFAYDTGRGVRKSKGKAVGWYRRAVNNGDAAAAHNIATVYRDRGDVIRAIKWLRHAVRLGDSGSNLLLGQLLLSHMGQPHEALECFKAVAANACDADCEAARVWAATTAGMIASSNPSRRITRD